MAKLDITMQTRGIDAFLDTLDNPLHRKIIANYRRHAIFEICGYKEKIFDADMTVEEPQYYLNIDGMSITLNGREEVMAFYTQLQDQESTVMVVEEERLAVADWGFASEAWFRLLHARHAGPGAVERRPGQAVQRADVSVHELALRRAGTPEGRARLSTLRDH